MKLFTLKKNIFFLKNLINNARSTHSDSLHCYLFILPPTTRDVDR